MSTIVRRIRNTIPWLRIYCRTGRPFLFAGPPSRVTDVAKTGEVKPASFDWEPLSKQLQTWAVS